jgi:uncharacterized membrane protein HdeD (DUF308 family)
MELALARNWWALALRGVVAIVFGLIAFFWPGFVWLVVVLTFAGFALIDGIFALVSVLTGHREGSRWWALLIEGIVGITAGVVALFWPGITMLALLALIAVWAVATGMLEIITAIELRRHIRGEWLLALSGILSIVLGIALAVLPEAGLVVIAWWVGAYAIAFGAVMLALAFRLRERGLHVSRQAQATVP